MSAFASGALMYIACLSSMMIGVWIMDGGGFHK